MFGAMPSLARDSATRSLPKLSTPPKASELRAIRCQAIANAAWADAQAIHRASINAILTRSNGKLPAQNLAPLQGLCDNLILLQFLESAVTAQAKPIPEPFISWLFGNDKRTSLFLDHVDFNADQLPAIIAILNQLYQQETRDADTLFPLMLAISIVWDAPRPPLHEQIAPQAQLEPEKDLGALYAFFRQTYASPRAAMPLRNLSVPALTFVVDTPVPIAELTWLQDHVRPRRWDDIFTSIRYDDDRAQLGQFLWNNGPYRAENIQQQGGICVDQAYFTTMAARAHGIPAILFVGEGTRGGHAWLAVLERTGNWAMDIGRFRQGGFTTGHASDPQTGLPISDHMVAYTCSRALQANRSSTADQLVRTAIVLKAHNAPLAAKEALDIAIQSLPIHLNAWAFREQWTTPDSQERFDVLEQAAKAFRQFPDVITTIRLRQAAILRAMKLDRQADQLLASLPAKVSRRDDLERAVGMDQIDAAMARKDPKRARELFEKLLNDQKDQGAKVFALIPAYLNLTQKTQQSQEALRFLKRYLPSLKRHSDKDIERDPRFANVFDQLLYQAYVNNGDDIQAERLLKRSRSDR